MQRVKAFFVIFSQNTVNNFRVVGVSVAFCISTTPSGVVYLTGKISLIACNYYIMCISIDYISKIC